MFSSLSNFILDLFLKLLSFFNSIVLLPITLVLHQFVPNIDTYFIYVYDFINNYIIKGVAFAREVFFNLTGFPRELYYFLISFFVFKFGFMVFKWGIQRVINAYYLVRGTKS